MPDPITHAIASPAVSVAATGFTIGIAGTIFGVDGNTLVWAFVGAVVWRAMQPSIDYTYEAIKKAIAWTIISMIVGVAGAVFVQIFLIPIEWQHKLAILPAFAAYFSTKIIKKTGEAIDKLEPPTWLK
jgi:hypothetical protein